MNKNRFLLAAAVLALPLFCLSSCRTFKYSGADSLESLNKIMEWDVENDWESDGANDTIIVNGDMMSSDGDWITSDIPVGEFNSLQIGMAADVTYRTGKCAVSVTTSEDVLDNMNVTVDGGRLVLEAKPGVKFRNVRKFKVVVSAPSLESITIDGSVNFKAEDEISVKDFELVVGGAGNFSFGRLEAGKVDLSMDGLGNVEVDDIDCSDLSVSVNGMGNIKVSGVSDETVASISGMGEIDLSGLKSDYVSTSVEGLGKIKKP